ncbi:hypothetical protein [Zavarzinia compransoris]|uniref:Invasion associated locus B family protein n=1 Tax=Zavarzinia compransoris TaxID=1264899 RepID=A0A317DZ80_9PROT|nr:hypothetical protein [Zavarzinia compransoris]PWR20019.1 hypothetical protein DKG75_16400 [Zavarzinia compransoris]TDP44861.1 hypothetical protein DES42_10679 [Zavarzinia compransoris]
MRVWPVLLFLFLAAAPAQAEETLDDWFDSKPVDDSAPPWTVDCAATSVIRDGRVVPGAACAAVSPPSLEGGVLRFWTEVRGADHAPLRGPAVALEFPIPAERLNELAGRFSGNAAILAAGANYHLTFHRAAPMAGRCDRLVMPARRGPADAAGPKALSFDRIGCQITDADGALGRLLLDEGGVGIALTIGGIRLAGSIVTGPGAEAGIAAAEERLRSPSPAAGPVPDDQSQEESGPSRTFR